MDDNKVKKELSFLVKTDDNDVFRSEVCHYLKRLGDASFVEVVISYDWVRFFWENEQYFKALYFVGVMDYLAEVHGMPLYPGYAVYRNHKLEQPVYPKDVLFLDAICPAEHIKETAVKECRKTKAGRIFLQFNIIERSVRDVV